MGLVCDAMLLRQSLARQVDISVNCITSIWRRYASVGTVCRRSRRGGRPKIIQQDVDLVAWLKTIEPTMSLKSLKDNVLKYSNSRESKTLPTI